MKRDVHENRRAPHGPLAKDILRYLATGVAIYLICSSPSGTRRLLRDAKKEWDKRSARLALERLRKHKLVSYREKDSDTLIVTITQEGRKKVKEWDIETMAIEKPVHWDKRWRVVTFDIAEERKRGRDALRTMLKRLDFYQLQRSVFVHPYSCRAEIEFICELFHLPEREVLYFSTDRIPNERILKHKFKLT